MNIKRLSYDELYEFLYQSNIEEADIPKSLRIRVSLAKKSVGNFRDHTPVIKELI